MNLNLYSDVILVKNAPDEDDVRVGDIGTLVEIHDIPGTEPGCSAEFFNLLGQTVKVLTLPVSYVRSPNNRDRTTTRVAN